MDKTFLIIDDDLNLRKMLTILIMKNNFGRVVSELASGEHADDEIIFYNPDIVLIDFLLPSLDGIEIIKNVQGRGSNCKFIMISQVEDEYMVSKAYESGVVFFIKKPINNVEAINVIRGVCHNIDLERSLALIKNTVLNVNSPISISNTSDNTSEKVTKIFADIGILGTAGSEDLKKLIFKVMETKRRNLSTPYNLQDIYEEIAEEDRELHDIGVNSRAIEQRIRRTIQKALETIAELGHADYSSSLFLEYGTVLFDFKQIMQQIRSIENPKESQGKINIKKFIEGVIAKLNSISE